MYSKINQYTSLKYVKTMRMACVLVVTSSLLGLSGCAHKSSGETARNVVQDPPVYRLVKELGLTKPSYVSNLPPEVITRFESNSPKDENDATLIIDSTGDRVFFPFKKEIRNFKSEEEVRSYIKKTFYGETIISKNPNQQYNDMDTSTKTNEETSSHGSYIWRGAAYFTDPDHDLVYRVTNPILAKLGGVYGKISISNQEVCIDPDGQCDDTYASYLEPQGEETGSVGYLCGTVEYSGRPVCVRSHTFARQDDYGFFKIAHIGANIGLTYFPALTDTYLGVSAILFDSEGRVILAPDGRVSGARYKQTMGDNFVESSMWCSAPAWGTCDGYRAIAVCGQTGVDDQDVNGTLWTGDGRDQELYCPQW